MPAYDINAKGTEFIVESFVDPGPSFDPVIGPPDIWFRRVLENVPDMVIAFQHDGTVTYVSEASRHLLGHEPTELIGTNALELLHPDDLANAADTIYNAAQIEGWRPSRPFRLRHSDGSFATFEVSGLSLFHVPEVASIVCVARWADEAARVDAIVGHLAANSPIGDIVDEIVHLMARPGWRIGVSIQYDDGQGELALAHTGLPEPLLHLDRTEAGRPWADACATGELITDVGLTAVGEDIAATARNAGFQAFWAIPVADPGYEDALIVVWNYELVVPELGQLILLDKLRGLLELALAGRSRARELELAASTDPLTSLANRRAFDRALAEIDRPGIALLLLDLDGFKAINDERGHAAGDEVIRVIGTRIRGAVRRSDLSARIGGDEFAVLCHDLADADAASRLATQLLQSISEPIALEDSSVAVGVSIGVAIAGGEGHDPEELFRVADHELYEAKQAGKHTFRLTHL